MAFGGSSREFERWLALRAARALWKITGNPNLVAEVASRLLQDDEEWLVVHAKNLPGEIGPDAVEAVPRLKELLGHEEAGVREAARRAVQKLE